MELSEHLDTAIIRAIYQSEIEGGVSLNSLPLGTRLEVQTKNTRYRVENRGDGQVLISGHPEFCPEPVLVQFHGSTWGTPMLKARFIGRGMQMEFAHPELGVVHTTRVREIRELPRDASEPPERPS
jgi:hypothetical protein